MAITDHVLFGRCLYAVAGPSVVNLLSCPVPLLLSKEMIPYVLKLSWRGFPRLCEVGGKNLQLEIMLTWPPDVAPHLTTCVDSGRSETHWASLPPL